MVDKTDFGRKNGRYFNIYGRYIIRLWLPKTLSVTYQDFVAYPTEFHKEYDLH